MKLSLNWVKQYAPVNVPVEELVKKIGAQLGEIEGVEDLSEKYKGAVVVKVVSCEDHPNADRLHVCKVEDGGITQNVERDAQGLVQVVCGAPNVQAGMLAVWLPPGVAVPESYDKEPFVLEARELRGVVSNGMLASPKELALGDSHDGILEVNPTEWSPHQQDVKPGAYFAQVFGLDDHIIDIENKMFTHRPDLFGQLGLAREVAGIQGEQFVSPDWYKASELPAAGSGLDLGVINEVPELVPRFMALAIKNVTVKPSPLWLQAELVRVGVKPINNIVDVTNYIMLLTAQPTHAYDYDKLHGGKLVARMAKPNEKVKLLNHKTYTLDAKDIVIADAEEAIGLAGVMGGGDSEVSDSTKNIVLECGTFDMYAVRRSSMRHGVFTDALTRFNKGQSPLQNGHVLSLLVRSIFDVAGGEVASEAFDLNKLEGRLWVHPPVPITLDFINVRLGLKLDMPFVRSLLEHVEFEIQQDGDTKFTITAPFWRTDIETREDVVEEVGRLYGYDHLPLELPTRSIKPVNTNKLLDLKQEVRNELARAGANEVLTYSFVHRDLIEKAGQDPDQAFRVSNALSPDLQYYRLSLTPSLLDKIHPNIKAGYKRFALFEIGKGHNLTQIDEDGLPTEFEMLDVIYAADDKVAPAGAAYYQVQALLKQLCGSLGIEIELRPIEIEEAYQVAKPYDHTRSAQIFVKGSDLALGMIGEYKASVRRNFKLPSHSAGFGLGLLQLQQTMQASGTTYKQLSRFPKVTQDMTFKVATETSYEALASEISQTIGSLTTDSISLDIEPLGMYQAASDSATKNISFRIHAVSYIKTMTDAEVTALLDTVATAATQKLGAERI